MILLYLSVALFIFYSILILYYRNGWQELKTFSVKEQPPELKISVLIPARNEEENISPLLTSLQAQNYPRHLFEVIVIDDNSSDNTASIVKKFPSVKLIELRVDQINSYKKKALETGIAFAGGDLIATTDADCIAGENWLRTIAAFQKETNAVFIAAPVTMQKSPGLLQTFQSLDFLVLQGITAASVQKKFHNMCNGANLAYEKGAFVHVKGFTGIDHIASGDDMLLMQKIAKRFPGRISYLLSKDAIVTTKTASTWKEFFSQRIRWASKATDYSDIRIFGALFLVYFFNCSLLALFITGFWSHDQWLGLGGLLIAKTIVEYIFIFPVADFYGMRNLLAWFPFLQPLHIVYTVIAGWLGMFGRFEWKGRRVK